MESAAVEIPSSADIRRDHLPQVRWAVGKTVEDVNTCPTTLPNCVTVDVEYGLGEECSLLFYASGKLIEGHLINKEHVPADTRVLCMWHVQAKRWIIVSKLYNLCGSGSSGSGSGSDSSGSSGSEGSSGSGSGSGSGCFTIAGIDLCSLPEDSAPTHVLSMNAQCCLVRTPTSNC
jgi:hypothetical protein